MALKRQNCLNHPERIAIGQCVITKTAICAECSTRYEGVNYSKEGLEILRRQREKKSCKVGLWSRILGLTTILLTPVLLLLVYYFYLLSCTTLVNLIQATLRRL